MTRWLRRTVWGIVILLALIALGIGGGFLWLRTSLPEVAGEIEVAGAEAVIRISRDGRGVPVIRAESSHDAYLALGFLHAQDRLFQMDAMRRLGAGRLAEVIGIDLLKTDKTMRALGLYRSAEAQLAAASPALRAALDAYADGVNAYMKTHEGAWQPEFYLLGYEPEAWQPVDSLVWGRLMALDLSANWRAEVTNRDLQEILPPYLFDLLVSAPSSHANKGHWRQSVDQASNSWSIGGLLSASGQAMIANDPHLALALPSTWYLARIEIPEMIWTGATAPGLPFIVIGTNGRIAWTFTTTHSDTQDLFSEKLAAGRSDMYETPDGEAAFDTWRETFRIKDGEDMTLTLRRSRHGPVISDAYPEIESEGEVLALSWAALLPDDRTPEAILAMNWAQDAAALEVALLDFHSPQQNVVYADSAGITGFIAAGRVPVRKKVFENGRLPAPGWTEDYDWAGTLPFAELPQLRGGGSDAIVTANNDIRPPGYRPFITADWPDAARARQIRALLAQPRPWAMKDFEAMQMDNHAAPLLAFVRARHANTKSVDPAIADLLAAWDGSMHRDLAAPLIATIWLDRAARAVFADELGALFEEWWFWQADRLKAAIADGRACDVTDTAETETCEAVVSGALKTALADLAAAYGPEPKAWRWGDSHRAHFQHPVFRNVPLVADWLDAELATDGDYFTVNRGTALPPQDGVALPHIHGPGLRFVHDFGDKSGPFFTLAGGQSGNPLSPHYADWLSDWRDGRYRAIIGGNGPELILTPQ